MTVTETRQPTRPPVQQQLKMVTGFLKTLYISKARVRYAAHVRRRPLARARLAPWRNDPYKQYEILRSQGVLTPGILPDVSVTVNHAMCKQILKHRSFGVTGREGPGRDDEDFNLSLLEMDPPEHTRLRRVAAPAFAPRRLAAYGESIEKTVGSLVDNAMAKGTFDLQKEIGGPLPISVISELLGIPDADFDTFTRYGTALGSALDGIQSLRHARAAFEARSKLHAMFTRLIDERRVDPRDDLLSALTQEEEAIRADEMLPLCTLLLLAGFETTVNLIGNAVHQLMLHRDQWRMLVADPSLAGQAIEETLRYDPPIQLTSRVAHEETEIAGHRIPANHWIVTVIGGANRDPEAFSDPQRFDITRTDNTDHLAFSSGVHYCIGAPLAKLEAEAALRVIAERMPRLHLAGKVPMRGSTIIHGVQRLPVSF